MNAPARSRTATKEARRSQLIDATIDVLAEKGFSSLTVSDVASKAGLSHGIVNFHFTSKDELLRETITQMEAQYCSLMEQALARALGNAAASLQAMAETEFCAEMSTERIIRAWAAFRSEAPTLYRAVCAVDDERFFAEILQHCKSLGGEDPETKANILDATLRGLVQRKLLGTLAMPAGRRIALACLHAIYPEHFPRETLGVPTA